MYMLNIEKLVQITVCFYRPTFNAFREGYVFNMSLQLTSAKKLVT